MIKYQFKKNDYLNRWLVSDVQKFPYKAIPKRFEQDIPLGTDWSKIIYPLRKDFLKNRIKNRCVNLPKDKKFNLYIPFENNRVEYTQFNHTPYELSFYAKSTIMCTENMICEFELTTCGSITVWHDEKEIAVFEPYTRNFGSKKLITLNFHKGQNLIVIFCHELSERDTNFYFSLRYLNSNLNNDLEVCFPEYSANQNELIDIENLLASAHLEYDCYETKDTHIRILFSKTNNKIREILVKADFQDSHFYNKSILKNIYNLQPNDNNIVIGKSRDFPFGITTIKLQIYLYNIYVTKCIKLNVYHKSYIPNPDSSITIRKKQALEFLARHGNNSAQKIIALLECNKSDKKIENLLYLELANIDKRYDCSDFRMPSIIWIYMNYSKRGVIYKNLNNIKLSILNYRYWYDEIGNDSMWFFSENHALAFHTSQYLAGYIFPDEIFLNSKKSGREQNKLGRIRLLRWFNKFFEEGYSEWNSCTYLPIDLTALFALYDLSPDIDVQNMALKALNITFKIYAINCFNGIFSSTYGRVYTQELIAGKNTESSAINWIAFGKGFLNEHVMVIPEFCISKYNPDIKLLSYSQLKNKNILVLSIQGQDKAQQYLWKTPEFTQASIVDYKPFQKGHQEHVYNLAIKNYIHIWINHPGELTINGQNRPSFWAGNGHLPRIAQYQGTSILLFSNSHNSIPFTHVYCPIKKFDYCNKINNHWLILALDKIKIAIYSLKPSFIIKDGLTKEIEIRSEGFSNIWIIKVIANSMNNKEFEYKIINSNIILNDINSLDISWNDFSYGLLQFSKNGDFLINGIVQNRNYNKKEHIVEYPYEI